MKNNRLIAGALAVGLLSGGGVALEATAAIAHTPHITVTCEDGVHITGTNYDGSKQNAWSVNIGGDVHSGTFGSSVDESFPLPQDGATTHVVADIHDADNTAAYSDSFDQNVGPCGTVPVKGRDVPINPVTFTPATCLAGSTYTVPEQDADVKYALLPDGSRPVPGTFPLAAGSTIQISAHVKAENLVANVGLDNPNDYTSDVLTGQAQVHNASCVDAITCHAVGPAYHEPDDNAAVLEADGWHIFSKGDGKATDVIFPAEGNIQGLTHFVWNSTGDVGNDTFVRYIVDLTADGGSAYNSLSVTDHTVTQASVANVGSKNVFLGKTLAQIADLYPDAVYHAISFQTGSAYAAGDGAVLTSFADSNGNCSASFVAPNLPEPKVVTTDWVDSAFVCGDTTKQQTRIVTTTTYSYNDNFEVISSDKSETESRTVALTDAEIAALNCPVVTPPTDNPPTKVVSQQLPDVLASTGYDATWLEWTVVIGGGLLMLGAIAYMVDAEVKRRRNAGEQ